MVFTLMLIIEIDLVVSHCSVHSEIWWVELNMKHLGENSQTFGTLVTCVAPRKHSGCWQTKNTAPLGEVGSAGLPVNTPDVSLKLLCRQSNAGTSTRVTRGTRSASKDSTPQNCGWSSAWKTPEQQTWHFQWDTQDDAITVFSSTKVRPFCVSHQGGPLRVTEREAVFRTLLWTQKLQGLTWSYRDVIP